METRYFDIIVALKHRKGGWLLRQLKGESRTAAEVVMDDAYGTQSTVWT